MSLHVSACVSVNNLVGMCTARLLYVCLWVECIHVRIHIFQSFLRTFPGKSTEFGSFVFLVLSCLKAAVDFERNFFTVLTNKI